MENFIVFVKNNKISFLLTILTALPAAYYIFTEFVKNPGAGDTTFDGAVTLGLFLGTLSIPLVGLIVFHFFELGMKWLFVLMIFIAPLMYFVGVFVAGWIALIIWLVGWLFLSSLK